MNKRDRLNENILTTLDNNFAENDLKSYNKNLKSDVKELQKKLTFDEMCSVWQICRFLFDVGYSAGSRDEKYRADNYS